MSYVFANGRILDGSGNPWRYGDVVVVGDKIVDVLPPGSGNYEGVKVVDAKGKFICPGFIDIQSHSLRSLMRDGRSVSKLLQGVTTEIMGEVWTPAPAVGRFSDPFSVISQGMAPDEWLERAKGWKRFGDWLQAMEDAGVSPNVGSFQSGGTLRRIATEAYKTEPTSAQLEQMKQLMAESMEDGAFGVAYALIYPPDVWATTQEIIEIARVVAKYNGVYITHMRSEAEQILSGLEEAMTIGRESGAAVEIYHLKACGENIWPLMPEVIRRIEQARAEGLDITADMYPYEASGTGLTTCLPAWVEEKENYLTLLNDPEIRKQIRADVENPDSGYDGQLRASGARNVMTLGLKLSEHQQFIGMRLDQIAEIRGTDIVDTLCDLLFKEQQRIQSIFFKMSPENTALQLSQPWVTVSSDAAGLDPDWAKPLGPVHPRSYGTYPRVLGKYTREEKLLTWEEAIRKMTSAVAQRLNLKCRGKIEPGYFADIVVFDPLTIADKATFTDPHQLSTGIEQVFVNGVQVVKDGKHTGATPGRFVRPGSCPE